MEAMVILSWLLALVGTLLKCVLGMEFHRSRFPNDGPVRAHHRVQWMTWDKNRQYRKEKAAYLRSKGTLVYDRILTAVIICGMLGFIIFGYLADRARHTNVRVDLFQRVACFSLRAPSALIGAAKFGHSSEYDEARAERWPSITSGAT